MTHRLILMLSALFLMFAVFGFVFALGANIGDNDDVAAGNLWLGFIMIGASVATLLIGLRLERRFDSRLDEAVRSLSDDANSFEADDIARAMNISLDDARDVLNTRARRDGWKCQELTSYNARYTIAR
ncbi:MAG TPA: hypothetical protein DCZ59_04450 [Bacteroidetes bacterium]|nr:hypothetical protein [Bacteroidota bacterium]